MGSSAGKPDAAKPPGKTSVKAFVQFVQDPKAAMTDCRDRYGAVFSTGSSLLQKIVGFVGPEALQQFEENTQNGNLKRQGAFPPGLQDMVGNIMPTTDDPVHGKNKSAMMQCFEPQYVKTYIPVMRSVFEKSHEALLEKKGAEFSWSEVTDKTVFACAIAVIFGVMEDADQQRVNLEEWASHIQTSSLRADSKGMAAKARVQTWLVKVVADAKARVAGGGARPCVLDNLILLKALPAEYVEIEAWHLTIAGCALVPLAAIQTMNACCLNPEYWKRAVEEMKNFGDDTKTSWDQLGQPGTLPFITQLIMEVKRFYVLGPTTVPAIAKTAFVVKTKDGNFNVPKGAMCVAGLEATCKSSSCWENPDTFDPARFQDFKLMEGNNQYRFCPQSFGTLRRCGGEELTTVFLQAFVLTLAPYQWKMVKGQNYALEPNKLAPKPIGGLKAFEFEKRSGRPDAFSEASPAKVETTATAEVETTAAAKAEPAATTTAEQGIAVD